MPQVVSESDVRAAQSSGVLMVPEGSLVTPLAREAAARLGVELGFKARTQRTVHVLGNWKMNLTLEQAVGLLERLAARKELKDCGAVVGVLPPYPYLVLASALLNGTSIAVGAQDASTEEAGAFTGDVSVRMIRPLCSMMLAGHSERRAIHGESSEQVWKKAALGIASGLKVVVCIGETAKQRDRGRMLPVLREQLAGVRSGVDAASAGRLLIAYEPIWAIGTGRRATVDQVEEAHREIRRVLSTALGGGPGDKVPILYGGSVQKDNAAELASSSAVDGFLVGGASLDDGNFAAIAQAFRGRPS